MLGVRTILAASGGGHLAQLVRLRSRLPFDPGEVTWFTQDTAQSRSLLAGEEVVHALEAPPRDWRAAIRNARLVGDLARDRRFDAAVSTGASVAVSTLPIARRHGAVAIYIESAARVEGPSMSGRLLARLPGIRTFCQYTSWAHGRWSYAGSIFDAFEPGPQAPAADVRTVVVTLGSQGGYPFDRLVSRLVEILPTGADILWQTGGTDAGIHGVRGVSFVPAAQMDIAMADADLVVAHAGVGSALSALAAGRHPVLVSRRVAHGEHVDDHQMQIAAELDARGLATACTVEDLDSDVLAAAARRTTKVRVAPPPLTLGGLDL